MYTHTLKRFLRNIRGKVTQSPPLQGPAYELPARQTCYRMLQGKNLTMNMSTRFVTKQEEDQIRAYYTSVTKTSVTKTSVTKTSVTKTPAPKSLVTNGVFYKKVFIESEGHTLEYNYDTNKGQCNSTQSNGQYFNISSSEGVISKYLNYGYINQHNVLNLYNKIGPGGD